MCIETYLQLYVATDDEEKMIATRKSHVNVSKFSHYVLEKLP